MKKRLKNGRKFLLLMKFGCFPVLIVLLFMDIVQAGRVSGQELLDQRVTIEANQTEVRSVLKQIERQTRARFIYSQQVVSASRKVSLRVEGLSLSRALDLLLSPLQITYDVSGKHIVLDKAKQESYVDTQPIPVFPEFKVEGRVTDEKGEALPGVSILVKGTQRGMITDSNGQFSMEVPDENTVLVFSFVGYLSEEVKVGNRTSVNISLRTDEKALEEVVVVGYGVQSRRNVTGAISKVSMKDTENLPNVHIAQALRGRVAGVLFTENVRPGQTGNILIRGPRSLSGGNSPLIVLDGIFFNGSLADLNPNDIESMEVLKDASAAAIYGSRAANGVILITSKKGATEKPVIRFNTFSSIAERSFKVKLLTPERYVERMRDFRLQSGLPAATIKDVLHPSELSNMEAGRTVDHWDVVSQTGVANSYDLSVSGKNNTTNYYLSSSFVNEKGLYLNDNMKRVSFRSNMESNITPWLKLGVNATYNRRDLSGLEPDRASNIGPYSTIFHEDGEPTYFLVPEEQVNQVNPIRRSLLTKNEEVWNNLFANFYTVIDVPFVSGLSYRINYSPNYLWRHDYNFMRQDPHLSSNTTYASKFNREDFNWVLENILSYSKNINENNYVDVTLLYGRNGNKWESTTSRADQLSSDALGWNNIGLGAIFTSASDAAVANGLSSMFRLNYRLLNRYLMTFTIRRDGSSVFAANNKYATFPSASLSWILTEENFLRSSTVIDLLKLRVSYGAVGNQAISPYQSLSSSSVTRYIYGDGGTASLGIYPSRMSNSDLKWESTYSGNIGVDFELFKNRLNGTFEVYNLNTKDLLVQRSLPTMSGYNSVWTNIGATNNKGLEVSLNSVNIRARDFEWSTSIVFSTNKNRIVHLYRADANNDGKEDDDLGNRWFIGHPINVAYDYVFDGIYQEGDEMPSGYKPGFVKLKDLNGDGKIDAANDRTILGQRGQPKYRWGLTNNFSYRNFQLSVFINALQGWVEPFDIAGNTVFNMYNFNRFDGGWWTPENKSDIAPSLVYTNPLGHGYYISRDYIRLQDISLSYDVPSVFLKKARFQNARVFLSGKNLLTWTKWPGADPEGAGTAETIPASRIFSIGLNFGL